MNAREGVGAVKPQGRRAGDDAGETMPAGAGQRRAARARARAQTWLRASERLNRTWPARFRHFYLTEHEGVDLAASIAYFALFYIFPLIGAVLTIIGLLLRDDKDFRNVANRLVLIFPEGGEWREAVRGLAEAKNNYTIFGILSTIGLFWFGATFIAKLARAFNRLYGVPSRAPLRRRLLAVGLIALFAALLAITVGASTLGSLVAFNLRQLLFVIGVPSLGFGLTQRLVSVGTALATAFILFLALYWIIPNARQGFCDVWRGTALAATLLVAATQLFPLYVRFAPGSRYGTFIGLVFLLTTWLYLLAHIILLGAAINAFRWRERLAREPEPEPCPVDAAVGDVVEGVEEIAEGAKRRLAPGNSAKREGD